MQTGKVSDYLDYKNASDFDDMPVYDEEFSKEFAAEDLNDDEYDEIPYGKEYEHDYEDGWFGDT